MLNRINFQFHFASSLDSLDSMLKSFCFWPDQPDLTKYKFETKMSTAWQGDNMIEE